MIGRNLIDDNTMKESYPLSDEQKLIAEAGPDESLIVLAPPGTGKTHTVVARIWHLIQRARLHPSRDLAVLCFTRAAVKEIIGRLDRLVEEEGYHDDLRFVTVRTFDSFATLLLTTADPKIDLKDAGYDARIRKAVEQLSNPSSRASEIIKGIRHLIVDEIQDLVGVRAALVKALLSRISGGYTLLGDPAQAIYGFALKEEGGMSSLDLLNWVRTRNPGRKPVELSLSSNYRSGGKLDGFVQGVREEILQANPEDLKALERLRGIISGLDSSGSALSPESELAARNDGSVCVLCRTNGEVLQVASMLSSQGVGYRLKPGAEESGLPAWLGRLLSTWDRKTLPQNVYFERWENLIGRGREPEPEQAWKWLKRVEGREGLSLDVDLLANRLYQGQRLPDDADAYLYPGDDNLHISTIHSSKGREFDHVVVLPPDDTREQTEPLEEARVLYVAATRAREKLTQLDRGGLPRLWSVQTKSGRRRWLAHQPRKGFYFIELGLNGDVERGSAANIYVNNSRSGAIESQETIWKIKPGDEIFIRKERRKRYTYYRIYHGEDEEKKYPLGQLSLGFKRDLGEIMKSLTKEDIFRYPSYFQRIQVAAVVTEVLEPFPQTIHAPFSNSRFCLGLRLRGMGYLWQRR